MPGFTRELIGEAADWEPERKVWALPHAKAAELNLLDRMVGRPEA